MAERGWQDDILASVPSGVDVTQIDENLRLTPTERLERMRRFLEAVEELELEASRGHRLPAPH